MSRLPLSIQKKFTSAFVLTGDDLKKYHEAMARFGDQITISGDCRDGGTRSFDLRQLLGYENSAEKELLNLTICASRSLFAKGADGRTAQLRLGKTWHFDNVALTVEGPESEVQKLVTAVSARVTASKPWYDRLTRIDFTRLLFLLLLGSWCALWAWAEWKMRGKPTSTDVTLRQVSIFMLLVFAVCTIVAYIGGKLNRLSAWLFPPAIFAIGKGMERHEYRDKWRWAFISSVVVAVLVNIAVGIPISMYFSR